MDNPSLNYFEQGQGEPLIILHGLFGSSRNWQSLSKRFAQHFRVITVDLRNHGDSFHDDAMDYPLMAQDIIALIDHLKLPCVHLLGHSMGGKVAMTVAQRQPQTVSRLVVADIAPIRYLHDYDDLIDAVMAIDLARVTNRKQVEEQLALTITDPALRLFLLQNLVIRQSSASWRINWAALKNNTRSIIGFEKITDWQIKTPTLFIRGELSGYVSDEAQKRIKQHFENVEFVTLANAGHWLHAEQPRLFYQHVVEFLLKIPQVPE